MIDRHLGAQVRRHRQARGFTQRAFGNRLGVSSHQIESYEVGIERIAPRMLIEIADILEIGLNELFQEPVTHRPLLH